MTSFPRGYGFGLVFSSLIGFPGCFQVTVDAVAAMTIFTTFSNIEPAEGKNRMAGMALFFKTGEKLELLFYVFLLSFGFPFGDIGTGLYAKAGGAFVGIAVFMSFGFMELADWECLVAADTGFLCEWLCVGALLFPFVDFFMGADFIAGFADMMVAIFVAFVF